MSRVLINLWIISSIKRWICFLSRYRVMSFVELNAFFSALFILALLWLLPMCVVCLKCFLALFIVCILWFACFLLQKYIYIYTYIKYIIIISYNNYLVNVCLCCRLLNVCRVANSTKRCEKLPPCTNNWLELNSSRCNCCWSDQC